MRILEKETGYLIQLTGKDWKAVCRDSRAGERDSHSALVRNARPRTPLKCNVLQSAGRVIESQDMCVILMARTHTNLQPEERTR